ncbi:unnamed protein product, partial [Mesorhabditis belari]|uniref:Arginyl-tRNA--protein transferase 1 n=1 Tax=Mesorhabditis belari TaxID=2138241 RepID=A0AAF3F3Z8_9BILA
MCQLLADCCGKRGGERKFYSLFGEMAYRSLVEYVGASEKSSCGYCRSRQRSKSKEKQPDPDGSTTDDSELNSGNSYSFGVWGHFLAPNDYQILLDRGWRRSGRYLYKPTMDKTCCPQYTIRLDVTKFKLSRTQRKVLRAMNDYLKNDHIPKSKVNEEAGAQASISGTHLGGDESPVKKKKIIRCERAINRWIAKGLNVEEEQRKRIEKEKAREKTLESFLPQWDESWKHKLEVRFVSVKSKEYRNDAQEEFELYKKYQSMIHEDKRNSFEDFERFLVKSPLTDESRDEIEPHFGSYHEQYRLDGKIIAVGVVDILPKCFSSKYLFYDPDYAFLTLGTYTALREISYVQSDLLPRRAELKYYYMGYYINSCPKMRYKGKFRPSDLLCDHSFTWVPLSECLPMLAANEGNFTIWREEMPPATKMDVDKLNVFYKHKIYSWKQVKAVDPDLNTEEVADKLREWSEMVGPEAKYIALYLKELNMQEEFDE